MGTALDARRHGAAARMGDGAKRGVFLWPSMFDHATFCFACDFARADSLKALVNRKKASVKGGCTVMLNRNAALKRDDVCGLWDTVKKRGLPRRDTRSACAADGLVQDSGGLCYGPPGNTGSKCDYKGSLAKCDY